MTCHSTPYETRVASAAPIQHEVVHTSGDKAPITTAEADTLISQSEPTPTNSDAHRVTKLSLGTIIMWVVALPPARRPPD